MILTVRKFSFSAKIFGTEQLRDIEKLTYLIYNPI